MHNSHPTTPISPVCECAYCTSTLTLTTKTSGLAAQPPRLPTMPRQLARRLLRPHLWSKWCVVASPPSCSWTCYSHHLNFVVKMYVENLGSLAAVARLVVSAATSVVLTEDHSCVSTKRTSRFCPTQYVHTYTCRLIHTNGSFLSVTSLQNLQLAVEWWPPTMLDLPTEQRH